MSRVAAGKTLLAIAPGSKGFGFFVLAGTRALDWRVKEIRQNRNARAIFEVDKLIELYRPDTLVLEDVKANGARRRERVCSLMEALVELASERNIRIAVYSNAAVRESLALTPRANKDDVAAAVAARLPVLQPRLPRRRRLWDNVPYAMPIFEAAALALTEVGDAATCRNVG